MKMLLLAALGLMVLLQGGCEARHMREPEPIVSTPLVFDPTEHYELSKWWSNGTQLLRLNDDASYLLYRDQNRYRAPVQRGRWSQQSYAVLWLEPYTQRAPVRQRVTITKRDGTLAVVVPGFPMMRAIKNPPEVTEDRLFGIWEGSGGRLRLRNDMRYSFAPISTEGVSSPITRSGQNGSWLVNEDRLVLQPDLPGADPLRLDLRIEESKIAISSADGDFARQADLAQ